MPALAALASRPTPVLLLDERDLVPVLGEVVRGRDPGDAATQDEDPHVRALSGREDTACAGAARKAATAVPAVRCEGMALA